MKNIHSKLGFSGEEPKPQKQVGLNYLSDANCLGLMTKMPIALAKITLFMQN